VGSSYNKKHSMQLPTVVNSLKALRHFSWHSQNITVSTSADTSLAKCEGKIPNLQVHAVVIKLLQKKGP